MTKDGSIHFRCLVRSGDTLPIGIFNAQRKVKFTPEIPEITKNQKLKISSTSYDLMLKSMVQTLLIMDGFSSVVIVVQSGRMRTDVVTVRRLLSALVKLNGKMRWREGVEIGGGEA